VCHCAICYSGSIDTHHSIGIIRALLQSEVMRASKPTTQKRSESIATGTSWKELHDQARGCRACPLWQRATQTVFGEGDVAARIMLVGEQPGNDEDVAGHPFIGPAGKLLDRALETAGISRAETYVTNAVKHFKWEPRGKRRIHAKPSSLEIAACLPWLNAEINVVKPEVIVCLGATAAQALLGKQFRVTKDRGKWIPSPLAAHVLATIHPSAILRATAETRESEMERFIEDLRVVAGLQPQ
jgi:uracil-DNA glycosylase family protein